MSETCIFCKIIKGEIPSKKVFENEEILAFLDINPITKGHTVVIPKNHYETILDLPEGEMQKFFSALKKVASMIKKNLDADGFNILQNNFKAAGQEVPHMHFHIIPRMEGDGAIKFPPQMDVDSEYLENVLKEIKS